MSITDLGLVPAPRDRWDAAGAVDHAGREARTL
jgi:hypothetical protein